MRRRLPGRPRTLLASGALLVLCALPLPASRSDVAPPGQPPAAANAPSAAPPRSAPPRAPDVSAPPAKAPTDGPPPEGTRRTLLVYGVNNYGYIDVCGCKHKKTKQGSVTRRASLLRQLQSRGVPMVLVDGGNTLFGRKERRLKEHERPKAIEKARVLVEAMSRMNYRAMTIGHFDLVLGLDTLRDLMASASFPVVCANYVDQESGELVFSPSVEIEEGGVRIAILGLTINTLQPYFLDMVAPGTRVTDGLAAARERVPALRERNDVVVVLSQNDEQFNRRLAREVPGIDFIVDPRFELGSSKIWIDEAELVEPAADSHIVRGDAQGARLCALDLWVRPAGPPLADRAQSGAGGAGDHSSFRLTRYAIEPHLLEDPDILQLVDAFRKNSKFVRTDLLPPLPNKDQYLTANTCKECHPRQHEWWSGTKHAHAFASLEKTGDQWRQDCIGCHVLGYGQAFLLPDEAPPYIDVQCESCHGLSPEHPANPAAHPWQPITEKTCLTCHNKRQTLVDFTFPSMRKQIACPKLTPEERGQR